MNGQEFARMMYADGEADGKAHRPPKYADVPEYSIGFATGEDRWRKANP